VSTTDFKTGASVLRLPTRSAKQTPSSASPPKSRRAAGTQRDGLLAYAFITPQLIGFLAFVLGPLIAVFYYSFEHYNTFTGKRSSAGLANYRELASNGTFAKVLRNTLFFSLGVIPVVVVFGLFLAILLNRKLAGIGLFRTAFFVPATISFAAWSLVWHYILQKDGGLNAALSQVGISGPNWLADPKWALTSIIIVQVLQTVGISMVLFLAALQDVPTELVEAARVDGAGPMRILRSVTIPLITPTVFLVIVLTTISTLKAFAQVFLLTQGGPALSSSILGYYIYEQAFNAFQVGYASALAVVLFAIVLLLTLLQWATRRRWVHHES
jgi:multiple sugar transport system permease protein